MVMLTFFQYHVNMWDCELLFSYSVRI